MMIKNSGPYIQNEQPGVLYAKCGIILLDIVSQYDCQRDSFLPTCRSNKKITLLHNKVE
jgi:hypothetical protein